MTLENIKIIASAAWLLTALIVATDLNLSWTTGPALVVFGLFPPMATLFFWREPAPSMSERIDAARR